MSGVIISTYLIFILLSLSAGGAGSLATKSGLREWYPSLVKPAWTPPGWLFAPVWTILYVLMGTAAATVYLASTGSIQVVLTLLFILHLAVNASWPYVFFKKQSPALAFYVILLLWMFVLVLTFLFYFVSTLAGILFVPYLIWTSYALTLNAGIMGLNPRFHDHAA